MSFPLATSKLNEPRGYFPRPSGAGKQENHRENMGFDPFGVRENAGKNKNREWEGGVSGSIRRWVLFVGEGPTWVCFGFDSDINGDWCVEADPCSSLSIMGKKKPRN